MISNFKKKLHRVAVVLLSFRFAPISRSSLYGLGLVFMLYIKIQVERKTKYMEFKRGNITSFSPKYTDNTFNEM
jgi:hypothetical protein